MDEEERLRRQEVIRAARLVAEGPRHVIDETARLEMRERERDHAAKIERERIAEREWFAQSANEPEQTSTHVDVSDQWNEWFDHRFMDLMTPVLESVAKHLAEQLDADREKSRDELAEEVRRLWAIITELQSTLRALDKIDRAKAAEAPAVHETIQ
jgi:hypothetical protein